MNEARKLPIADGRQTWHEVWRISRGHRLALVAIVALGLASAAAGLVVPAAIGHLVDRVRDGSAGTGTILWAMLAMTLASVLASAGTAGTIVLTGRAYHAMLAKLREKLIERAMALPQGLVERAGTGDLVSRSSDDVSQIADAAPRIIPAFTTVLFTIIATFAGMAALDPWYALAMVAILPVYILTLRWYLATAPGIYQAQRAAMGGRAQQVLESQRAHATVVGLGLTERRHHLVLDASWGVVAPSLRARTVQNMFFGRLNLAEFLGMGTILVVGFWQIGRGESSIGAATAAMLLFLRLFGPINQLLIVVDVLQSVLASLSRMVGVTTMPDDVEVTVSKENAGVRLAGVSFSYDGARPALDGVDLTIEPGSRVALVGASGAGKTTLATIIAGIHKPQAGDVIRPARTALITQDVHVFAGTLRDNFTLAAPGASDDAIRAALDSIGAADLPDLLPHGLDTEIGAGRHDLTAAQAQQVALARLVLADPEFAILDEASSEAGSTHAGLLDRAADTALAGRTGLVIAHRLSQAAACDYIVVMEQGRIVEEGRHDALIEANGSYARLWAAWRRA